MTGNGGDIVRQALSGIRVLEVCDELGQYAGKLLADLGADVIKIEPPAGEGSRLVPPFVDDIPDPNRSLSFWYYNTNKRSIILNLADQDADQHAFLDLVRTADIVIEGGRPGRLASLGLGFERMRAARSNLIMCSMTPFGQDGPWSGNLSSDMVALALGGQMNMCGYDPSDAPDAPPIYPQADHGFNTAGHFAAMGMLVALLHRDQTGEGQYIDCSMHEALAGTTELGMPYWLYGGQNILRQTGRHASVARTERWVYRARDGRDVLVFGVGRDSSTWPKVKRWLQGHGFGFQLDEARFDDPQRRQPGRGSPEAREIMETVAAFIAATDAETVYREAQAIDQAWGVVRTPDETVDDPHWWDRSFFVDAPVPGDESRFAAMPGAPYLLSATPWTLTRPAPNLGEHTDELLAEIASTVGS